jgi:hypothetical protein
MPRVRVVLRRPRVRAERVIVMADVRRATIGQPTCRADASVSLKTALVITVGSDQTRVGTVGPWDALRAGSGTKEP